MEEMLGNVAGARQIFERWMAWEPDHHGWMAYIKARGGRAGRDCNAEAGPGGWQGSWAGRLAGRLQLHAGTPAGPGPWVR